MSVKSIRGQLSVLAFSSMSRGLVKASGNFRLRKMLEGWARESASGRDVHQRISPQCFQETSDIH